MVVPVNLSGARYVVTPLVVVVELEVLDDEACGARYVVVVVELEA